VAIEYRRYDPKLLCQPVKLPDHQRIAGPPTVESRRLLEAIALDARGLLDKHFGTPSSV
jgi:hypothetical protein